MSRIGAGFDTVDTRACEAHGVWVANSPDYGVGEVATHALALALASIRNVVATTATSTPASGITCRRARCAGPRELTLGIVGLGRIGKRMAHVVAQRLQARDRVRPATSSTVIFRLTSSARRTLDELAGQSDVVSLHTPLNAETRGLVGAAIVRGGEARS